MNTEDEKKEININNSNFIKLSYDVGLSKDQQKENILSLFTEDTKKLIRNKHLSCHSLMAAGKELHVIYIADDEEIKNIYNGLKE